MNFKGIELCCPHCRGELTAVSPEEWACVACGRHYPVIAGIPDLRVFPDPYIEMEPDRAKGRILAEAAVTRSFPELVDYYYQHTDVVPPQHAQLYKRGLLAAASRSKSALAVWQDGRQSDGRLSGHLLDIGCGTGPLVAAAAPAGLKPVGVDIAFRWLVVGQRRLLDAGVDAPLICACAEALPFRDGAFTIVAAESMLEHGHDQKQIVQEVRRVLVGDGRFCTSTPNKFSLGPDPHVGIPAGGYLPDGVIAWLVRRQGGIPPKRRLLSRRSLAKLLGEAGFVDVQIALPDVPPEQRAHFSGLLAWAIDGYHLAKRLPGGRPLLEWIGPLLYACGKRGEM